VAIACYLQSSFHILQLVLVNQRIHSLIVPLLYEHIAFDCINYLAVQKMHLFLYRKLSDTKAAVGSTISTLETSLDYSGEYNDFDLYTLFPQLPNLKRFSLSIWIDSALDPLPFSLPSLADGLCSCCVNSRLESLTLNIDQLCYIDSGPGIGSLRYLTALKHIRIRAHLWLDGGGRRKMDEGFNDAITWRTRRIGDRDLGQRE